MLKLLLPGLLASVLMSGFAYYKGRQDGEALAQVKQNEVIVAAGELITASQNQSRTQKDIDDARIKTNKEKRDEATKGQTNAAPSSARIAFNCERLHQAGADLNRFPACGDYQTRLKASSNGRNTN